jgi:hypothetical protein
LDLFHPGQLTFNRPHYEPVPHIPPPGGPAGGGFPAFPDGPGHIPPKWYFDLRHFFPPFNNIFPSFYYKWQSKTLGQIISYLPEFSGIGFDNDMNNPT